MVTRQGESMGDVEFCVIGLIDDLQKRGLSREDAWKAVHEIERRVKQYKRNPQQVPPFEGE